jgi:hypothetical protein
MSYLTLYQPTKKMKSKIAFAAGIFLASLIVASADSYTITITPGRYNAIANQLNNGGNTLNELFPFTAQNGVGSVFDYYPVGSQVFSGAQFDPDDLVWYPSGDITLSPGGGALLDYTGPETTLTFTGTRVSSPVLITPVPNALQFVSDQLPEVGTWDTIIAVAPGAGTIVRTWDPMLGSQGGWVANTFDGSTWSLGAPTAAVGEAWNVYYIAPVPEPAVSALLGLGALAFCQRFAKNRRS